MKVWLPQQLARHPPDRKNGDKKKQSKSWGGGGGGKEFCDWWMGSEGPDLWVHVWCRFYIYSRSFLFLFFFFGRAEKLCRWPARGRKVADLEQPPLSLPWCACVSLSKSKISIYGTVDVLFSICSGEGRDRRERKGKREKEKEGKNTWNNPCGKADGELMTGGGRGEEEIPCLCRQGDGRHTLYIYIPSSSS